jgi:hypothetical protein
MAAPPLRFFARVGFFLHVKFPSAAKDLFLTSSLAMLGISAAGAVHAFVVGWLLAAASCFRTRGQRLTRLDRLQLQPVGTHAIPSLDG